MGEEKMNILNVLIVLWIIATILTLINKEWNKALLCFLILLQTFVIKGYEEGKLGVRK